MNAKKDNAVEKDRIICGDAKQVLRTLPDDVADLTVTSPPYFRHRDYGVDGQLGREATVDDYITNIRGVLKELLRVTAETGACFFVIGDTYRKQRLLLVPHRIAIAADELGWTVRNDLIWSKLDPPAGKPAQSLAFGPRACSVPHQTTGEVQVPCRRYPRALLRRRR